MQIIKIGICDDEENQANFLKEIVTEYLIKKNVVFDVKTFQGGQQLIRRADDLDIIFLDIEMPDLDGIETGMVLRRQKNQARIIMATGMVERFKESFKIEAFRFITKPFQCLEIEEALDAVLKTYIGMEEIELYQNRNLCMIRQNQIEYIKALDSCAEFIVGENVLRKDISLEQLERILDSRIFFRIHRKLIINMKFIEKYGGGIVVVGGEKFIIARRKKKLFEMAYLEFDLNYR